MSIRKEWKTQPAKQYEAIVEVCCDLCGKKAPDPSGYDGDVWAKGSYEKSSVQVLVKAGKGEVYPEGGSVDTRQYDICPECFDSKLVPFLEGLKAKPREDTEYY